MKQSTGHGSKYDRKKEEAIIALLNHRNLEDAARAAGIGSATLIRWLQQKEFQAEYRKARREAFLQAIARLQQASSAAVSTLLKLMVDPATPASSRIRAASSALDHARYGIEIEDILGRLAEVEQAVESRPEPHAEVPRPSGDCDVIARLKAARERVRLEDEREAAESAKSVRDASSSTTPSLSSDVTPSRESRFEKPE